MSAIVTNLRAPHNGAMHHLSPEWCDLLDAYALRERAARHSPDTIRLHRYHLARFAARFEEEPSKVTLRDVEDWIDTHAWSEATARSVGSTLRTFFTWAAAAELIERNPCALLITARASAGVPRPASDSAVRVGLDRADERVILMIRLAAEAGLRASEVARAHRRDVERDLIGWSLRVLGKGRKVRTVPISDELANELLRRPSFIFPGRVDGHLSAAYVSKLVSRVLPEGVTAHMLRHRFATRAYALGGRDIRAVQELLGHTSVRTTQVYTDVTDDALRRAALAAA